MTLSCQSCTLALSRKDKVPGSDGKLGVMYLPNNSRIFDLKCLNLNHQAVISGELRVVVIVTCCRDAVEVLMNWVDPRWTSGKSKVEVDDKFQNILRPLIISALTRLPRSSDRAS
jgi:hypothetical protein